MNNHVQLKEVKDLFQVLFPLNRSITGEGLRKTLRVLRKFDWEILKEWQVSAAYIKDSSGRKIVDFSDNNLHLVSYSKPVNKMVSFKEFAIW